MPHTGAIEASRATPTGNPFAGHELRSPALPLEVAHAVARERFGVDGAASPLGSHQDQNVLIDAARARAVLKVANSVFSREELELQNAAMHHLAAAGLPFAVPVPVATLDGSELIEVEHEGERYHVRLVTFVEGETLDGVRYLAPTILRDLGAMAARTVVALGTFDHPGADRTLQWDLQHARAVVDALGPLVVDARRRALGERVLHEAEAALAPLLPALRRQVIHGDVTDYNVVFRRDPAGRPRPCGLIDLGDMARSWLAAEPAVLCASLFHHDPARALQTAVAVVGAFHSVQPLSEEEVAALWPLIATRASSCAISTDQQASLEPGNPYAAGALESDWGILEAAAPVPFALAHAALREACGLPPSPTAALVSRRLRELDPPPIVDLVGELRPLDLSVCTDALTDGAWEHPDAVRASVTASPGQRVGRYGEPRLTAARRDSSDEPASLHLGADLFVPPGTPVRTPIDGEVVRAGAGEILIRAADVDLRLAGIEPHVVEGPVSAGDAVGCVADAAAGSLLPAHVHVQLCVEPLDDLPGLVPPSLGQAWLALCPDPSPLVGTDAAAGATAADELLTVRRTVVASPQVHYYEEPPEIERGYRHHLYDTSGRAYLDMVNNVAILGHSHPRVERAAARQLRLLNTNSRFLYSAMARFAERLVSLAPDGLEAVFLVSSGSEANDLALRLVRDVTGRRDVLCIQGGYHGWTTATYEVSTSLFDNPRAAESRPPWIHPVEAPSLLRGRFQGEDAGPRYAAAVRDTVRSLVAEGRPPAALICEPLFGNAGGVPLPDGYLTAVYATVREAGGLCIADEVQVGYGRLGECFWAFEQQDVVPDVITIAKATGNGHPVAAVITTRALADAFGRDSSWFSSVGGSPVSCEVGLAVLDVMAEEGLQENARVVGAHLRGRLAGLVERFPICGAVHGMGLYLGLELVRDRETLEPATEETYAICERMLELGVVIQPTGDFENVLKIKPPLCLTRDSADFFVDTLTRVLETGW